MEGKDTASPAAGQAANSRDVQSPLQAQNSHNRPSIASAIAAQRVVNSAKRAYLLRKKKIAAGGSSEGMSANNRKISTASTASSGTNGSGLPTALALSSYSPTGHDIWMLGITTVIGGQYFSWNAGLDAGYYGFLASYGLISVGYIILCCCTAEITSYLPFAGGAYGLSRVTLGFFPGYLIGICEAIEYIAYVATSVVALAQIMIVAFPSLAGGEPVIWFLFYVTAVYINVQGHKMFWYFNWFIGLVSLIILLIYCFGSLAYVDFSTNVSRHTVEPISNGFKGMLKSLPIAPWFFVGVEAISMASDQVPAPKRTIPLSQVICVLTLFAIGTMVYFVTISLPPIGEADDSLHTSLLPLSSGFSHIFPKLSNEHLAMLAIPASYATAFGFMWAYGRLICAMGNSKLLPPILGQLTDKTHMPAHALIAGSVVSYALCLLVVFLPSASNVLFNMCILSGFMAYSGQMIGYISLKKKYFKAKHTGGAFHSPFGIPGALVGLCIWFLAMVGSLGYQGRGFIDAAAFSGIVITTTVYYLRTARKRQTLSLEENKVLLVAHVMKFNKATNRSSKKNKIHSTDSSNKDGSSHGSEARSRSVSTPQNNQQAKTLAASTSPAEVELTTGVSGPSLQIGAGPPKP